MRKETTWEGRPKTTRGFDRRKKESRGESTGERRRHSRGQRRGASRGESRKVSKGEMREQEKRANTNLLLLLRLPHRRVVWLGRTQGSGLIGLRVPPAHIRALLLPK